MQKWTSIHAHFGMQLDDNRINAYQVMTYSKTCVNSHSQKDRKLVFKTNYHLIKVKSIAECSKGHSATFLTFIKLPFVTKIYVLSIFEWPFYAGFTVTCLICTFVVVRVVIKPLIEQSLKERKPKS